MTRPSWTLGPSIFPGHILDQTAKPCAVKIALNPLNENHLSGEGAKPRFCCWSQPGQGKYLDNVNSCGESKTPAYFSGLLLIILLIVQRVLKAQLSAVGRRQSFYCWLWPGTAKPCSAQLPHAAAGGRFRAGSACRCPAGHAERESHCKEIHGAGGSSGQGMGSPVPLLSSAGRCQTSLSWWALGKDGAFGGWRGDLVTGCSSGQREGGC